MRLKQVCAFGNTETVSGIELTVNLRMLLSLPCKARKPWAGTYTAVHFHGCALQTAIQHGLEETPEVPVTN